jgi:hypothetical protein
MVLLREANFRNPTDTADQLTEKALHIVRKARKEDPAFPDAKGNRGQELLYLVRDLQNWAANRPNRVKFDDVDPEKVSGE